MSIAVLVGGVVVLSVVMLAGVLVVARRHVRKSHEALAQVKPGVRPRMSERTERGVLGLYDDELILIRPDGPPLRIPMAAISDVVARAELSENSDTVRGGGVSIRYTVDGRPAEDFFPVFRAQTWIDILARVR